jgi:UDPglucose 6-dehydrogenase
VAERPRAAAAGAAAAHRIAVLGTGYVGLTTGACLCSLGHRVICADVDSGKVSRLARGEVDIREPGLAELQRAGLTSGRLSFVTGIAAAVTEADMVFLCLPTPAGPDGIPDLSAVEAAVDACRRLLPVGGIIVIKSTVPVGTAKRIAQSLGRDDVAVVANPEFLREGSTVADFLHPDRIVVGCDRPGIAEEVAALYAPLGAPAVLIDAASAELAKYAANCFLAMKLSYVNAIAELCERLEADICEVTEALGYDGRIGGGYLSPGPGWGGPCLPKDTQALVQMADAAGLGFGLLRAAIQGNMRQQRRMAEKVRSAVTGKPGGSVSGKRIGLLGLTFKAGTNDLRESPALAVAARLHRAGAELAGCDPAVPPDFDLGAIRVVADAYAAAADADAIVVLTEWAQFITLDWMKVAKVMRTPVVVDTRNLLDPEVLRRSGLVYTSLGRGVDARSGMPDSV